MVSNIRTTDRIPKYVPFKRPEGVALPEELFGENLIPFEAADFKLLGMDESENSTLIVYEVINVEEIEVGNSRRLLLTLSGFISSAPSGPSWVEIICENFGVLGTKRFPLTLQKGPAKATVSEYQKALSVSHLLEMWNEPSLEFRNEILNEGNLEFGEPDASIKLDENNRLSIESNSGLELTSRQVLLKGEKIVLKGEVESGPISMTIPSGNGQVVALDIQNESGGWAGIFGGSVKITGRLETPLVSSNDTQITEFSSTIQANRGLVVKNGAASFESGLTIAPKEKLWVQGPTYFMDFVLVDADTDISGRVSIQAPDSDQIELPLSVRGSAKWDSVQISIFSEHDIIATGHLVASDRRIKRDLEPHSSEVALQNILQLVVQEYGYVPGHKRDQERRDRGLVADEVAGILPHAETVTGDRKLSNDEVIENLQAVNYQHVLVEAVAAIQELFNILADFAPEIRERYQPGAANQEG